MNSRDIEQEGKLSSASVQPVIDFLMQHSRTSLRGQERSTYSFSVSDLLGAASRESILSLQASQLGKPEPAVVGTLFAKRYSVFCMGLLGVLSLFDLRLASSPEEVRFRMTTAAAMEYETRLTDSALLPSEYAEERLARVTAYSNDLQQHLELVFHSIAASTGANVQVMWSLVSHNLQTMYARMTQDPLIWQTEERLRLIQLDSKTLFEPRKGNKLAIKLRCLEHPFRRQAPLLIRRHCCLSYKIVHEGKSEKYCLTCPKWSVEERVGLLK